MLRFLYLVSGRAGRGLGAESPIQEMLHDVVIPESARVRRSRAVLQAYCYEQFGAENQELAQAEGWTGGEFVPGPDLSEWGGDAWDLAELDQLWLPEASAGELAVLYRALTERLLPGGIS